MTNDDNCNTKEKYHGDFSSGFLMGVLAGMAGYFLTKTDEGRLMKDKITLEWKEIRKKLADEGIIHDNHMTVADMLQLVKSGIVTTVGEDFFNEQLKSNNKCKPKVKKKRSIKRAKKKEKVTKKKMFKGL